MDSKPRVAVLMATYNGARWLVEQVNSILRQSGVVLDLYISDDLSSDDSLTIIKKLASEDTRITVLQNETRLGSAGQNFYRLIKAIHPEKYDYVSFADQDDIWDTDKLIRHIGLAEAHGAEGVSSNVTAFWPDGRQKLLNKSQPQRLWDFLFESAGPGCSFLMRGRLVSKVQALLNEAGSVAATVHLHDWLSYAVCRANGGKWLIDSQSSLLYRQHESNVLGANHGLRNGLARLGKLRDGWYRSEIIKVSTVAYSINSDPAISRFLAALHSSSITQICTLGKMAWQGRRSLRDRLFLMACIMFGLF